MKLFILRLCCFFGLSATSSLYSAIIFEDQFDSNPTGATRVLNNLNGVSTSNVGTSPFHPGSGNYLHTSVTGVTSGGLLVTYSPTSIQNSWEALAGTQTHNGINYTSLNGGYSFFTRINAQDTHLGRDDIHWLRPVDIQGSVNNGVNSQGIRLILEGNAAGALVLQLIGSNPNMMSVNSSQATTFASTSAVLQVPNFYQQLQEGTMWHMGFTFETNPTTGQITVNLFGREGTGHIDTTSTDHLLTSLQVYINDDLARNVASGTPRSIFGGLRNWTMNARPGSGTFSDNSIDYDGIRLYSGVVTEFAALPVPEPSISLLLIGSFVGLWSKRQRPV